MIQGIGMDLVEIARIRRILEEPHGARFVERVLTPEERELAVTRSSRLAEFVAGRFAAKEAVAKALGCGIGRQVGLQDIRVVPERGGKPVCSVSGAAWARLGLAAAPAAPASQDKAPPVGAVGQAPAIAGGNPGEESGLPIGSGWSSPPAVRLHLTITHTETTAAAFAVVEQE